jgi:hypothetical protein
MERHEILEAMGELKLYGMRASFDEIAGKGLARRDELYPLIASLIRAERIHRQARSISYRISGAKFPVLKDLDSFVFADTPVDQGQVRELATGTFLDAKRNSIFIGGTEPDSYCSPRYVIGIERFVVLDFLVAACAGGGFSLHRGLWRFRAPPP